MSVEAGTVTCVHQDTDERIIPSTVWPQFYDLKSKSVELWRWCSWLFIQYKNVQKSFAIIVQVLDTLERRKPANPCCRLFLDKTNSAPTSQATIRHENNSNMRLNLTSRQNYKKNYKWKSMSLKIRQTLVMRKDSPRRVMCGRLV